MLPSLSSTSYDAVGLMSLLFQRPAHAVLLLCVYKLYWISCLHAGFLLQSLYLEIVNSYVYFFAIVFAINQSYQHPRTCAHVQMYKVE